jgi:hypothetical protein
MPNPRKNSARKSTTKKTTTKKSHIYTRKNQKGGNKEDVNKKILVDIDKIKKEELKLDILDTYAKMNKPTKANKYVIMGCMKRISEQIELKEEHKDGSLEDLRHERIEKFIKMYMLIPKHLKKDTQLVQLFLHYEPKLMTTDIFPKSLKRKEFLWKTALSQDPKLFYFLDKVTQRHILRKYPELLLESTDKLNINIKGGISIDKLPDLATSGDAFGIMLAAILGPQLATAFSPALLEIGTPITAALEPIILGIVAMLTDAGVAMKVPIIALGEGLTGAAAALAPLAAIF